MKYQHYIYLICITVVLTIPTITNKENTCPDGNVCMQYQTCCQMKGGAYYGCCPYKNAQCCKDGIHCCPQNYTCELEDEICLPKLALNKPITMATMIVTDKNKMIQDNESNSKFLINLEAEKTLNSQSSETDKEKLTLSIMADIVGGYLDENHYTSIKSILFKNKFEEFKNAIKTVGKSVIESDNYSILHQVGLAIIRQINKIEIITLSEIGRAHV